MSETDLLRQVYVLLYRDKSCRSNCLSHPLIQTTAGHPHCSHAGVGVAGSSGCVVPCGRRHELLFAVGAFVSSLSEHVSPEQPGVAPLVEN